MKLRRTLIVVAILLLCGPSCTQRAKDPTSEVLDAVKRYNGLLRRAYLEANISLLGPVATQKQIDKVFPIIQALRSQNSSMITEQISFKVLEVSAEPGVVVVRTEEEWEYWWQDKDSGLVTKQREEVSYRIAYRVVQEGPAWKVAAIEPLSD